jgi:hypothetical protein
MASIIRLRVGRWQLDYDQDYGIERRRGWSAAVDGSYESEFVSLWRAILSLLRHRDQQEMDACTRSNI